MGRALLAAHQTTGDNFWLGMSQKLADFCLLNLAAPGGGFNDLLPGDDSPGALARPKRDFRSNAKCSRWLIQLGVALRQEDKYKPLVMNTISYFMSTYKRYGSMAAGFALAVADVLLEWTTIDVIGRSELQATRQLLAASGKSPASRVSVRHIDPVSSPEEVRLKGLDPALQEPTAFICKGKQCFKPVSSPEQITATVESHFQTE
jgi:uncharacterized protein YyaL (SSP411 family)